MAATTPTLSPFLLDHPLPAMSFDAKTRKIIAANKAATKALGYSPVALKKLTLSEVVTLPPRVKLNASFSATATSGSGDQFAVKAYLKVIKEKNRSHHFIFLHETESHVPEKRTDELEEKHSRVDKIVRVSHNEIYLINDPALRFEYANNAALKNLGYTDTELRTLKITDLFSFPDEMGMQALLNAVRRGDTDRLQLQLKFTRKNGSHYDADVLIQVLEKDRSFLWIVNDITSRLVTEKKLLDTIHEKETLIKEIHHRVKNNLQLISSIIYLKLTSVTQSDIKNFLEDTRQKIRSIALIHERLLQTENLDKVELSDYLGKLVHDLKVTYYKPDLSLEMTTDIQEKMIGLDTAIICGLIVNELVTNAIKHAFTGRAEGMIEIVFREPQTGRFSLAIRDNGVSLPAHISPGYTQSFGMQLVDVFVKQLGGTFEIIREKGTTFQIHF
jgi:PAS domain S-box-containing protein